MRLLLTLLIVLCAGIALFVGWWGLMLGMEFSSHPIKGSPDAPYWQHLRLGLTWGGMFAALPALAAVAFGFLRHRYFPQD